MKTAWYTRKWVNVLLHLAAWLLLFSLPFLLRPSYDSGKPREVNQDQTFFLALYLLNDLLLIGLFYLNAYVLMPGLLGLRRYARYFGALILYFAGFNFIDWILFRVFMVHHEYQFRNSLLISVFPYIFIMACSLTYRLVRDKAKADRSLKERENESLKTELSLLRSQVSPHFMFNVLNNMVALARKQSDQLEPSLIKLSSLMRYMIYEADEDRVPLEREIEYLQSYIDLQKQRFGRNVVFNVSLQEIDSSYEIEPMLLIPFVENAIKHGTGFIDHAQIDIELKAKNQLLHFLVRNRYNETGEEVKDKTSGIGLANVQRRLNLLYGKNHTLLITRQDAWFTVSLQLKLH
ncbi:MAG TPA: histidine kinase [Chitinophagaceae bacterium]|nr:histidine kinase [Chitinophagaceae bacterium]